MKTQKNQIEQAKEFYGNKGINSVYTVCVKSSNGNYFYAHILNGNDKRQSFVYNPKENKTEATPNDNIIFGYLIPVVKLEKRIIEGFVNGSEVAEKYESNEKLSKLAPIDIY